MPKKTKNGKKNGKKKKYRMYKPLGGFRSTAIVKLRYATSITLNASSVSYATYVFSANGLYDVDISAVGHQPANFDVWSARYDNYCVLGSKISALITPATAASQAPGYVGIYVASNTTEATSVLNTGVVRSLEQNTRNLYFKRVPGAAMLPANGLKLTQYYSPSKVFGVDKKYYKNEELYMGGPGTNPINQAYYTVWQAAIAANNPGAVTMLITIDFTVRFSNLNAQQPSS